LERALKRFEDQVQLVLYPLALNDTSEVATQFALCAGAQGKFWQAHKMLYQHQAQWNRLSNPLSRLLELAGENGLDAEALQQCVKSGKMKPLVKADQDYGRSLQIRSTPTVFINNRRIVGAQSEADFVRTIRQELTRAERAAQQ
jgi:protein-disulfide isomerase